jgi:hypothetical protein
MITSSLLRLSFFFQVSACLFFFFCLSHPPPENHQPGEVMGGKKENGNIPTHSLPLCSSIHPAAAAAKRESKTIHNYISLFFFLFFSVVEGKKETKCQGCYIYIYSGRMRCLCAQGAAAASLLFFPPS